MESLISATIADDVAEGVAIVLDVIAGVVTVLDVTAGVATVFVTMTVELVTMLKAT